MSSLRALHAAHAPLLLIDAASSVVQVALAHADGRWEWQTSTEESGVGIFQSVRNLSLPPSAAGGFLFCDGPGSILGIRTAAMALRTWCVLQPRPIFAYSSLAIVALACARENVGVIADARRDSWHHFQIGRGLSRLPTDQLSGDLVMPEGFRNWSTLPPGVRIIPYGLSDLLLAVGDADLFRPSPAPDAFLYEEPSYVTWSPQIHRAPAP